MLHVNILQVEGQRHQGERDCVNEGEKVKRRETMKEARRMRQEMYTGVSCATEWKDSEIKKKKKKAADASLMRRCCGGGGRIDGRGEMKRYARAGRRLPDGRGRSIHCWRTWEEREVTEGGEKRLHSQLAWIQWRIMGMAAEGVIFLLRGLSGTLFPNFLLLFQVSLRTFYQPQASGCALRFLTLKRER